MPDLYRYDHETLETLGRTDPNGLGQAIAKRLSTEKSALDLVIFTQHLQVDDTEVRQSLSKALFGVARELVARNLDAESKVLWAAIRMAAVFANGPAGLSPLLEFLGSSNSVDVRQVSLQALANVSQQGPLPNIPEIHDLRRAVLEIAEHLCDAELLGIPGVAAVAISSVVAATALGIPGIHGWTLAFQGRPLLLRQLEDEIRELTADWPAMQAPPPIVKEERTNRRIVDDGPRQRPRLRIGQEFTHPGTGHVWRVTDVGTRTFLALDLTDTAKRHPEETSWLNGPPYALAEHVWDEYDVMILEGDPSIEWEDSFLDPCPAPHAHSPNYHTGRGSCYFCGKVRDMSDKCTVCKGEGKVLGDCELSPNVWFDKCEACDGTGTAQAERAGTQSELDALLEAARTFTREWRDQEGCGAFRLDALADATEAYDKTHTDLLLLQGLEFEQGRAAAIREAFTLRRQWAMYALDSAPIDLTTALWPESVLALVREYSGKPIGACDDCGKRAPLFRGSGECPRQICAWGCKP